MIPQALFDGNCKEAMVNNVLRDLVVLTFDPNKQATIFVREN